MSRIHDALQKAEKEREAEPANSIASPSGLSLAPAITNEVYHASGHPSSRVEAINPRRGESLRLEDVHANCVRTSWRNDSRSKLFGDPTVDPQGAEQFRTLRSRLYQLRGSQNIHTILVTSSIPAEGKTFVTSNLAHAFICQPDRRVLIIDADLRRPSLHKVLGAPSGPGLTDYLSGTVDEVNVIQKGQEDNLYFVPGGIDVRNPSELLLNGRLKGFIDRIAPAFDWVILDSPPCLPVADASTLADICDGVLLVVRAASTPIEMARRACQELQAKRLLGVVFNAAEEGSGYCSYNYAPTGKTKHEQLTMIQAALEPTGSDQNHVMESKE